MAIQTQGLQRFGNVLTHKLGCRRSTHDYGEVWSDECHSRLNIFPNPLFVFCQVDSLQAMITHKQGDSTASFDSMPTVFQNSSGEEMLLTDYTVKYNNLETTPTNTYQCCVYRKVYSQHLINFKHTMSLIASMAM